MLLVTCYVLYQPFAVYARYPEDICSPLDIRNGAYIVEVSKEFVSNAKVMNLFKDILKCVKEFIERNVETDNCLKVLNTAKQMLSAIQLLSIIEDLVKALT